MIILGKPVYSVSINPVISMIKLLRWVIVCQEAAVMPDMVLTIRIAQASEKVSNWKYLLKVAQTMWYLATPGWSLQEDGTEIDSSFPSFYFLMEVMHDPKIGHDLRPLSISMLCMLIVLCTITCIYDHSSP